MDEQTDGDDDDGGAVLRLWFSDGLGAEAGIPGSGSRVLWGTDSLSLLTNVFGSHGVVPPPWAPSNREYPRVPASAAGAEPGPALKPFPGEWVILHKPNIKDSIVFSSLLCWLLQLGFSSDFFPNRCRPLGSVRFSRTAVEGL